MTPQQLKAMKLALEALELLTDTEQTFGALDYGDNAITALKEALAEHAMRETQRLGQEIEQEPVAWFSPSGSLYKTRFHATANGEQVVTPLYATPPQRTWVGLTDAERNALLYLTVTHGPIDYAVAIEQALKERNT